MRILVVGANGFIAREIIARLAMSGHDIVACVHSKLLENVPHSCSFKVTFTNATTPEYWLPYLEDIDVVINCVGVFQTINEKTMWNIHYEAPKALFAASSILNIKKIIHISALGIDKVNIPYATSKLAIEAYIQSLDIASTIIRPGLVYGKGSYGGTSLFRGLAGLPFILPLPGNAKQLQQPIHVDDLTRIVEKILVLPGKQMLCAVGTENLSIQNVLMKLRNWLGFKKAYVLSLPNCMIRMGAKIGNLIPNSPLSETGIKMLSVDNTATKEQEKKLQDVIHFKPRGFTEGLNGMVSSVQDRWHARLYFLRPLLRISIAFIWIFSGIISIVPGTLAISFDLMAQSNIPMPLQPFVLYLLAGIDILLGLATLLNIRLLVTGSIQCFLIIMYTILISFFFPVYWLHPFAPIAKNIPILVGVLVMMALGSER
jgi:nucleoside-diphosphate-sugar epimerase